MPASDHIPKAACRLFSGTDVTLDAGGRRRLFENFERYAAGVPAGVVALIRERPADEVAALVDSLQAAFAPAASPWHDVYVAELERCFALAQRAPAPWRYLHAAEGFAALADDADGPLQQRLRHAVLEHALADDARVRRLAVRLLRHFARRDDDEARGVLLYLAADPDRQVRRQALLLYNTLTGRPWYAGLRRLERLLLYLRAWFDEL